MAVPERLSLLAALALVAAPGLAADRDLEARVQALERRLSSRVLMEMLQRLDQLQQEVQALRGQVETLQYQVARLSQAQNVPAAPAPVPAPPETTVPPPEPAPAATVQADGAATAEAVQRAYRQAFDQLQAGHYDAAIDAFSEFLQRYPEAPLAANAYYWLGEAYYVKRDFPAAAEAFRQVVERFPASPKAADALLKLGYVAFEQGRWEGARRRLQAVVERFPGTRAARLAADRLERMRREGRI